MLGPGERVRTASIGSGAGTAVVARSDASRGSGEIDSPLAPMADDVRKNVPPFNKAALERHERDVALDLTPKLRAAGVVRILGGRRDAPRTRRHGLALDEDEKGGQMSLDSFAVLSKIGEGSFGKVVLARRKVDGRLHAIKAVRKEKLISSGEAAIQHMLDENRILQRLRHPFILTLQYAFQDECRLYLVTNYVGGGTLYQLVSAEGRLREELVRFYAGQLVCAFEYLHFYGVVYRDLKPENVLLGLDGYVVLADFGLAKTLVLDDGAPRERTFAKDDARRAHDLRGSFRTSFRNSVVKTETFCGTPLYLAPEVVARTPYGRSVDWWTLGCLCVELLTGRPPFLAGDLPELMAKIAEGTPDFLRNPGLGQGSKDFCGGLLRKDPKTRLGCSGDGQAQLRKHAFFGDLDFQALEAKRLEPPYQPDPNAEVLGLGFAAPSTGPGSDRAPFENFATYARINEKREEDVVGRLCDAARKGDVGSLRELVADGADVNAGDYDDRTALHLGAAEGRLDVVEFLVNNGAEVNRVDRWRGTPLRDAETGKHERVVAFLTKNGATPSRRSVGDETDISGKLCEAARRGDVTALKELVEHGADVNAGDYDDRTALHLGAAEGRLDVVEYLVTNGAEVNRVDRWRGTPLRDAEAGGHEVVVTFLLKHGAARRRASFGSAPRGADVVGKLCEAARHGDLTALRELIEDGADVNEGDYDDRTALHLGAAEGRLDVVEFLVAHGAEVDRVDRWQGTPLRDAETGKHEKVVAFLTKNGATPSRRPVGAGRKASMPRSISFSRRAPAPVAPEPATPQGLVIHPPARGTPSADGSNGSMRGSMDKSNSSCIVC